MTDSKINKISIRLKKEKSLKVGEKKFITSGNFLHICELSNPDMIHVKQEITDQKRERIFSISDREKILRRHF